MVTLPESNQVRKCASKPPPKPRVVTTTPKWSQYQMEGAMPQGQGPLGPQVDHPFAVSQMQAKLGGYKCQDVKKNRYNAPEFVSREDVRTLILEANGLCYYCLHPVQFVYEHVREPTQWTLDRIDNSIGHVRGNLVLACLTCNLRRRCIHSSRYSLTKQLQHIVLSVNTPG
jgi:hypothetical protein